MAIKLGSATAGGVMVPANILTRVFSLRVGTDQASGFTIEVDGRQYLVTAGHLLPSFLPTGVIEVFRDTSWIKLPFHRIPVEPDTVDIAVLALGQQLSGLLPVQVGMKDSFLSQDVYFVGFPYGLSVDGHALNSGFPIPLVKHGIIAAFGFGKRGEPFLVDGINNPGFSGGPVVRVDANAKSTIIGVVSAYRAAQEAVYREKARTDLTVRANTGLLVAYSVDYAVEAIQKSPVGYRVQSAP